ncbi:hypothetical protein AAFF_G00069590 [Aldrovandia affinis]|uniref:[histone H3]-lysine(4) N-trimethyltransferase n=1 Tax=Aldrovandia affinis TaxID=143900 RepID=A0AAD7RZA0_9TELE|nr:hypothetical protein AAFF_G00069590 [Aldrovandia affinis]
MRRSGARYFSTVSVAPEERRRPDGSVLETPERISASSSWGRLDARRRARHNLPVPEAWLVPRRPSPVVNEAVCSAHSSCTKEVTCNCFSISDGELQEVGVGIYPSVSLLNHACRPNCVMVFEGRTLLLRAVRDIQPLEELTISYTDMMRPSKERRKRLQEQYYFLCQCEYCTSTDTDSDMLSGPEEAWMSLQHHIPQIELLQSEQKWEQILTEFQALARSCADTVPDRNIYLLRLLDLALDSCINLAQWDRALEFGTRTLQPYRLYYPDPHPARAIQLMRVGKLQHLLGRLAEARDTLGQAYDVMKVTHGSEHALTNQLRRMREEIEAEMGSA